MKRTLKAIKPTIIPVDDLVEEWAKHAPSRPGTTHVFSPREKELIMKAYRKVDHAFLAKQLKCSTYTLQKYYKLWGGK